MKKNDYEEELREEKAKKEFLENLIKHNEKTPGFEEKTINKLIYEILTKLTDRDVEGKKYIEYMYTEDIHQYIKDLGILYNIKDFLKGSDKSNY